MKHYQIIGIYVIFLGFCLFQAVTTVSAVNGNGCDSEAVQDSPCSIQVKIISVEKAKTPSPFPDATPLPVLDSSGRQIYTSNWEVKWRVTETLPVCTEIRQFKVTVSNDGGGETTVSGSAASAIVTTRRVEGESVSRIVTQTVTGIARTRVYGETVFSNGSISRPDNVCNLIPISILTNLSQAQLEMVRTSSPPSLTGTDGLTRAGTPSMTLQKHGLRVSWTVTLPTQPPLCVKIDGFRVSAKIRYRNGVVKTGAVDVSAGTTSALVVFDDAYSLNSTTGNFEENQLDRIEEVRVTARVSPDIVIYGTQTIY